MKEAIARFLEELARADSRDILAAVYAFYSPEPDSHMLLDADARALHDALVELKRWTTH